MRGYRPVKRRRRGM